jgi:hypothetical protein
MMLRHVKNLANNRRNWNCFDKCKWNVGVRLDPITKVVCASVLLAYQRSKCPHEQIIQGG